MLLILKFFLICYIKTTIFTFSPKETDFLNKNEIKNLFDIKETKVMSSLENFKKKCNHNGSIKKCIECRRNFFFDSRSDNLTPLEKSEIYESDQKEKNNLESSYNTTYSRNNHAYEQNSNFSYFDRIYDKNTVQKFVFDQVKTITPSNTPLQSSDIQEKSDTNIFTINKLLETNKIQNEKNIFEIFSKNKNQFQFDLQKMENDTLKNEQSNQKNNNNQLTQKESNESKFMHPKISGILETQSNLLEKYNLNKKRKIMKSSISTDSLPIKLRILRKNYSSDLIKNVNEEILNLEKSRESKKSLNDLDFKNIFKCCDKNFATLNSEKYSQEYPKGSEKYSEKYPKESEKYSKESEKYSDKSDLSLNISKNKSDKINKADKVNKKYEIQNIRPNHYFSNIFSVLIALSDSNSFSNFIYEKSKEKNSFPIYTILNEIFEYIIKNKNNIIVDKIMNFLQKVEIFKEYFRKNCSDAEKFLNFIFDEMAKENLETTTKINYPFIVTELETKLCDSCLQYHRIEENKVNGIKIINQDGINFLTKEFQKKVKEESFFYNLDKKCYSNSSYNISRKFYTELPKLLIFRFPRIDSVTANKRLFQFNLPLEIKIENKIWNLKSICCLGWDSTDFHSYFTTSRNSHHENFFNFDISNLYNIKISSFSYTYLKKNKDAHIAFYERLL